MLLLYFIEHGLTLKNIDSQHDIINYTLLYIKLGKAMHTESQNTLKVNYK